MEAASNAFILTPILKWVIDHDISSSTVWVKACRRFNLHKSALFQAWRYDESLLQVCLQLTIWCLTGCCESPVLSSTVPLTSTTHSLTKTTLAVTEATSVKCALEKLFNSGDASEVGLHTPPDVWNLKPLQQYYQLSLGLWTEGHCYHNNQTSLFLLTIGECSVLL